ELERLVGELGLADRVELHGALRRDEVARVLAGADVLVNNAPGGADRIVYEAAASGIPVLASNRAHADLLEQDAFYARDDAAALAAKLCALAALPEVEPHADDPHEPLQHLGLHPVTVDCTSCGQRARLRARARPPAD